jgi:protein-tyrosine phosphatase
MTAATHPDRHVVLTRVFNFRDLGGYPTADGRMVRWRTLYRADGLHRLTDTDVEVVRGLGLRTVVDLRTAGEVDNHGRFPVEHLPVAYHHLPVIEEIWPIEGVRDTVAPHEYLTERYLEMLDTGGCAIARTLGLLADGRHAPLVFHCAAGKDRTGVLSAVVLGLLGVPDEEIAHDYGLSLPAMARLSEWVRAAYPEAATAMEDQPAVFFDAPSPAVHGFLDGLRGRFGSFEGYVEAIGVDPATVGRVRARLLAEPGPTPARGA